MKNTFNKGFGILAVVIILAIAAAVGGGVYYSKHKNLVVENETDVNGGVETEVGDDSNGSTKTGTLRSLLSLGGDMQCSFSSGTSSSGTVYVSGDFMRGDFSSGGTESHMIKSGGTSYVWSGSQGMKMDFAKMDSSTSTQSNSNVNLDQSGNYSCHSWVKDGSKFTVPSTVSFFDMNAMMQGAGGVNSNVNTNVGGSLY